MEGGAAGEGGDADDDFSAAATYAFKGMPAEELTVRKKMVIGELASQKRKKGAANWRPETTTHFFGPPPAIKNDGSWYRLGTAEREAHSKAKRA